jgi:hypothetical protein
MVIVYPPFAAGLPRRQRHGWKQTLFTTEYRFSQERGQ